MVEFMAWDPKLTPLFNSVLPIPLPTWKSMLLSAAAFFPPHWFIFSLSPRPYCSTSGHFYVDGKLFSTYSFSISTWKIFRLVDLFAPEPFVFLVLCFFYHLLALLRLLLPLLLIPPPTIFLKIGFATAPIRGPAKPAKSPSGNAPPFCLLLPPICQTPFFIECLPRGISKQYALFFLLFQSILKSRHHSDL